MFSHFCLNFAKTGIVTHILVNILVANLLKPTISCLIHDMQMDVHNAIVNFLCECVRRKESGIKEEAERRHGIYTDTRSLIAIISFVTSVHLHGPTLGGQIFTKFGI